MHEIFCVKEVEIPPSEFSKVRVSLLGIQSSARIMGNWGGGGRGREIRNMGKKKRRKKREEKRQKKKTPKSYIFYRHKESSQFKPSLAF